MVSSLEDHFLCFYFMDEKYDLVAPHDFDLLGKHFFQILIKSEEVS